MVYFYNDIANFHKVSEGLKDTRIKKSMLSPFMLKVVHVDGI